MAPAMKNNNISVNVRIPASFAQLTHNKTSVKVSGTNIKNVVDNLGELYPGIKEKVFDSAGNKHDYINIYVNDEDIRFLQQSETPLNDGDTVFIIPAIAGG